MLIACWSAKGGAGTTVVATSLSLLLARRSPAGALLADLGGDAPAALGMAEPDGPGLAGWLAGGASVPADALARLEVPAHGGLALLPRGAEPSLGPARPQDHARRPSDAAEGPDRAEVLAALLGAEPRPAVVDCGTGPHGAALVVAAGADRSVLVTRACFLSLRRAVAAPIRPSEVVLVEEPGRSLRAADVEEALGVPVVAQVASDPAVARAVDAGLLATRLPRGLARQLDRVA